MSHSAVLKCGAINEGDRGRELQRSQAFTSVESGGIDLREFGGQCHAGQVGAVWKCQIINCCKRGIAKGNGGQTRTSITHPVGRLGHRGIKCKLFDRAFFQCKVPHICYGSGDGEGLQGGHPIECPVSDCCHAGGDRNSGQILLIAEAVRPKGGHCIRYGKRGPCFRCRIGDQRGFSLVVKNTIHRAIGRIAARNCN